MLTQKELKRQLHFNPETGVFTWVNPYFRKAYLIGKIAGSIGKDGYLFIKINKRSYSAHRLAWFYVHGVWPSGVIDHRDHCVTNNAISNLRDVTFAGNSQNRIKANKSNTATNMLGVRYNAEKNRYQARIQTCGKRVALGGFATALEAHQAYIAAKRELHMTCTI